MAKQDTPPTNPDAGELKQAKRILEDIAKRKGLYQEDFTSFIVTPEELAAALSRYIQKECDESNKKLMTEIRADAYRKARFELRAHPRGIIIDANKIKWYVFEKYFAGVVGLPDLIHQKESLEKEK